MIKPPSLRDENPGYFSEKRSGTVILSPHSDDAAFSVGGMLIGRLLPEPVTIITIFGKSNYTNGLFHDNWRSISHLRQVEDVAFTDSVGAKLISLEFPEAGVRIAPNFDVLFLDDGMASEPSLTVSLQEQLFVHLQVLCPTFVLAPLGLGNHRDHVAVRAAARAPTERSKAKLLYYEDLPYADALTQEAIGAHVAAVCACDEESLTFRLGENLLLRQIERLGLYRSQVDSDVRDAIGRHLKRYEPCHGGVRLWGRPTNLTDFLQHDWHASEDTYIQIR